MSVSAAQMEDIQVLKNMVADTLARRGVLGKLKAELRANVLSIIKQQPTSDSFEVKENLKLQRLKGTREGRLLLDMIAEFLEFFDLSTTMPVYTAETGLSSKFESSLRPIIVKEINLPTPSVDEPVLITLLRFYELNLRSISQSQPQPQHPPANIPVQQGNVINPPIQAILQNIPSTNAIPSVSLESNNVAPTILKTEISETAVLKQEPVKPSPQQLHQKSFPTNDIIMKSSNINREKSGSTLPALSLNPVPASVAARASVETRETEYQDDTFDEITTDLPEDEVDENAADELLSENDDRFEEEEQRVSFGEEEEIIDESIHEQSESKSEVPSELDPNMLSPPPEFADDPRQRRDSNMPEASIGSDENYEQMGSKESTIQEEIEEEIASDITESLEELLESSHQNEDIEEEIPKDYF